MLTKTLLNELQAIIRDDFGCEYGPSEINEIATSLLGFFEVIINEKTQ